MKIDTALYNKKNVISLRGTIRYHMILSLSHPGTFTGLKPRSMVLRGNTILVKLELWELVIVYLIKHFGLPLTYAYVTLWRSVAVHSTFR